MKRSNLISYLKSVIYPNNENKIDAQKHQDLEVEFLNSLAVKEDDFISDPTMASADTTFTSEYVKEQFQNVSGGFKNRQNPVVNVADLSTTYPSATSDGWAAMVTSVGYIYAYNASGNWVNTGLTAFPEDVVTTTELQDAIAEERTARNLALESKADKSIILADISADPNALIFSVGDIIFNTTHNKLYTCQLVGGVNAFVDPVDPEYGVIYVYNSENYHTKDGALVSIGSGGGGSATVDADSVDNALAGYNVVTSISETEQLVVKGKKRISFANIKSLLTGVGFVKDLNYIHTDNNLSNDLKSNYDDAYTHVSEKDNPHEVTAAQVGTLTEQQIYDYVHANAGAAGSIMAPLYPTSVASDISGYYNLSYTPQATLVEATHSISTTEELINKFLYQSTIGTTHLDAGNWIAASRCKVDNGSGDSYIRIEFFLYHTDGTTTVLFSALSNKFSNTDYENKIPQISPQGVFTCSATDRLGVNVYAYTAGAAKTLYIEYGGGTPTYFSAPLAMNHDVLRNKNSNSSYQHVTSAQIAYWNSLEATLTALALAAIQVNYIAVGVDGWSVTLVNNKINKIQGGSLPATNTFVIPAATTGADNTITIHFVTGATAPTIAYTVPSYSAAGAITGTQGSNVISGTATYFTYLRKGDKIITASGDTYIVATKPTSNTGLTVTTAVTTSFSLSTFSINTQHWKDGIAPTLQAYTAYEVIITRVEERTAGMFINRFNIGAY